MKRVMRMLRLVLAGVLCLACLGSCAVEPPKTDEGEKTPSDGENKVEEPVDPATLPEQTLQEVPENGIFTINGKAFVRTFYDSFVGTALDETKWERCPEWERQGGACRWDDSMTSPDGEGNLVLTCDYDDEGNVVTGAVHTRGKFEQAYGYFEARVKLQKRLGFWSAFWLMPNKIDTGIAGGSDGTEIDIFEAFSIEHKQINHAIHYDGYGEEHRSVAHIITTSDHDGTNVYDGKYHIFAMEWTPDAYIFFIDGRETARITTQDSPRDHADETVDICTVPAYLLLTLETGSWTGKPAPSRMPDHVYVDYVAVYRAAE